MVLQVIVSAVVAVVVLAYLLPLWALVLVVLVEVGLVVMVIGRVRADTPIGAAPLTTRRRP
jgi:hypothetical protein